MVQAIHNSNDSLNAICSDVSFIPTEQKAIIIANSNYDVARTECPNLEDWKCADKNAAKFSKYLNEVIGIPSDKIMVLKDASLQTMDNTIRDLKSELSEYNKQKVSTKKILLWVFYTGQGFMKA